MDKNLAALQRALRAKFHAMNPIERVAWLRSLPNPYAATTGSENHVS